MSIDDEVFVIYDSGLRNPRRLRVGRVVERAHDRSRVQAGGLAMPGHPQSAFDAWFPVRAVFSSEADAIRSLGCEVDVEAP